MFHLRSTPLYKCKLLVIGHGKPTAALLKQGKSVSIRAQQLKSRVFGFVYTKLCVASWDLSVPMFLHDPKSLKFGLFLLVPTIPVLKSLSLKKLGFAYNPTTYFPSMTSLLVQGISTSFKDSLLTNTCRKNDPFSLEWQTSSSKL